MEAWRRRCPAFARPVANHHPFQPPLCAFTLDGSRGELSACRVWESTWKFIHSCVESHSCLSIGTHLTSITARKLRSWAAIMPRAAVDLHRLCVSYQSVGAMGLPRDVIEVIVHFHHNNSRTLRACSLTCRALFSAVRGLIHRRVELSLRRKYPPCKLVDRITANVLRGWRSKDYEVHMGYLSMVGKRGLLGYAREVSINIAECLVPEALETCLPHFRSLTHVHTLKITGFDLPRFLPSFERYFAQFIPTLRSLHLPRFLGDVYGALEFICKFPHLDDLSLLLTSSNRADVPPALSMEYSPPLRGTLVLRESASVPVRFLLKIPGGLRFRSIYLGRVDKEELDEILASCSSNLRTLSLSSRSLLNPADLSRNMALTKLHLRADYFEDLVPALSPLLETLSTISSPTFWSLSLRCEGYHMEFPFRQFLSGEVAWRDEWGMIDRKLNDMVRVIGRKIWLVFQIKVYDNDGEVWPPALRQIEDDLSPLGGLFPLMNARGLVKLGAVS